MVETIPEPFDKEEADFLGGDDHDLDIDDLFGYKLEKLLDEYRKNNPEDIEPQKEIRIPSLFDPEYHFQDVPSGILLLDPKGKIVGAYIGAELTLEPDHRGRRLGMEMVLERCLRDGENPVLNLDTASYSQKGLRAHRTAWLHARQNPQEMAYRLRRWHSMI